MEGDQYHNSDNDAVIDAKVHWKPSNKASTIVPYTEASGDPKLPYAILDVWVKETKYYDKSQRE